MKAKKILLTTLIVMLVLSIAFNVSVYADHYAGTYSDGETLRMENFYPSLKVDEKSIYEYNGKIVAEYYNYNTMQIGNSDYYAFEYCNTYLESAGWKRDKSNHFDNGVLVKEYYTKNNYNIDLQYSKTDNIVVFLFCSDEYYTAARDDEANVKNKVYDTVFGGEKGRVCGENLKHTISDKELTISGNGKMYDYPYSNAVPWYEEPITKVIISDGVTSIGDYAFSDINSLTVVEINSSVISIGASAFAGCENLKEIHYAGTQAQWNQLFKEAEHLPQDIIIYFGDGTKLGKTDGEKDVESSLKQLRMTIGSNIGKLYGKDFVMDVAPQIINGRTMLPARYVTENLGGEIEWIGEHQMVAITKGSNILLFKIGSDSATLLTTSDEYDDSLYDIVDELAFQLNDILANSNVVNDNYIYDENMEFDYLDYKFLTDDYYGYCETYSAEVQLDSAPIAINGRTFMPVRVIATFLGADVQWDGATQTVIIEPK